MIRENEENEKSDWHVSWLSNRAEQRRGDSSTKIQTTKRQRRLGRMDLVGGGFLSWITFFHVYLIRDENRDEEVV